MLRVLWGLSVGLAAGILMSGCISENDFNGNRIISPTGNTPTQRAEASNTPASTSDLPAMPGDTSTPLSTPTLTNTAGPSPTTAPTPAFGSARVGDDFLFSNQPEGCEFPCWQGLVIGQSTIDDVQSMFHIAFGFEDDVTFLEDPRSKFVYSRTEWEFAPDKQGDDGFSFLAVLNSRNHILEGIEIRAESPRFEVNVAPQYILRKLGEPSHMLVSIERGTVRDWGIAMLVMFYYDRGITVEYLGVPLSIRVVDSGMPDVAKMCLGASPPDRKYDDIIVYFTGPIASDLTNLSPIQESWFGSPIRTHTPSYKTFEEVFNLSLEEVTTLAQQQENLCLEVELAE